MESHNAGPWASGLPSLTSVGCAHLCSDDDLLPAVPPRHHPQLQLVHSAACTSTSSPTQNCSPTASTTSSPQCQDEERLYAPCAYGDCADASMARALASLVEQLRSKVDRLQLENAQLKNEMQVMVARQAETEHLVARLQAAETYSSPRMTGKRARMTTTTSPTIAPPGRGVDDGGALEWRRQEGPTVPSVAWWSPSAAASRWTPLVHLLQALPSLTNYVLPGTLMAPDLQSRSLIASQTSDQQPPRFVYANAAFCSLPECSPDDVIGQSLIKFFSMNASTMMGFAHVYQSTPMSVRTVGPVKSVLRARSGKLWRATEIMHIFYDKQGFMKIVIASMTEWEPGRLQKNEVFDVWWPMTERRRMLLTSSPTTDHMTPSPGQVSSMPSLPPQQLQPPAPPVPAEAGVGGEHHSGVENAPEQPDHPWFTGPPQEQQEGSPSDYWSLI